VGALEAEKLSMLSGYKVVKWSLSVTEGSSYDFEHVSSLPKGDARGSLWLDRLDRMKPISSRPLRITFFFERRQKPFTVFLLDEKKRKNADNYNSHLKLPTTRASHSNRQRQNQDKENKRKTRRG